MIELTTLASRYGWQGLVVAAVVYVILRSDIRFNYPRKRD